MRCAPPAYAGSAPSGPSQQGPLFIAEVCHGCSRRQQGDAQGVRFPQRAHGQTLPARCRAGQRTRTRDPQAHRCGAARPHRGIPRAHRRRRQPAGSSARGLRRRPRGDGPQRGHPQHLQPGRVVRSLQASRRRPGPLRGGQGRDRANRACAAARRFSGRDGAGAFVAVRGHPGAPLRRGAGAPPRVQAAVPRPAVRRADHRRHGALRGPHRRDEDR